MKIEFLFGEYYYTSPFVVYLSISDLIELYWSACHDLEVFSARFDAGWIGFYLIDFSIMFISRGYLGYIISSLDINPGIIRTKIEPAMGLQRGV